jgi:hypothetical protein
MALFKCSSCKAVYEDYYPPDDTCLKCKIGTVRIISTGEKELSTVTVDKHVDTLWTSFITVTCC